MNATKIFYGFALTILFFYILVIGKKLLIPFVLAVFIWYLINVLAGTILKLPMGKKKMPTWTAFSLAIIAILGILSLLVQLITDNISEVIKLAPQYQQQISGIIERFFNYLPFPEPPNLREIIGNIKIGSILSQFALVLTSFVGSAGIIMIYLIFLFLEQKNLNGKINAMLSRDNQKKDLFNIIRKIDRDVRLYVGVKTFTSALTGILSYAILKWVDLDFAAFWALMIFVFNFIPNVGSIIATIFPSILALVQFQSLMPFLAVAVGVGSLQFLIGNVLDPKLMGNSLNMSPLTIILSLVLWGSIWGVAGMILCVPIVAIAMIILTHFEKTRPLAILLSKDGKVSKLK